MVQWTKLCKNAWLFAALVSELLERPHADQPQGYFGIANGTWQGETDVSTTDAFQGLVNATTTSTSRPGPNNGMNSSGEDAGSQADSDTESLSPVSTLQVSSKPSTMPPSTTSLDVTNSQTHTTSALSSGTAGQPDEVDEPQMSTSTRNSTPRAALRDNSYLFVVPLMLAGLGLFHKLLSCRAHSIEEATRGVACLLGGLVCCLFPVALISFLVAQGFPLPKTMCIWEMPGISETPCAIFDNAKAHTYASEPTVERWVTLVSWGLLNVSYNLLAWALSIGLSLIVLGAFGSCLSAAKEAKEPQRDEDGGTEDSTNHCLPFLLALAAAAVLLVLGVVAFLVVLGTTVIAMLLFASFCVLAVSLVLVPFSAVYARMVSSSSQTFGGSVSVATGWRRSLQPLAMVLLTWAGGSVSFLTDLCNMTTALQTWLQGGCGGDVACQALGLVGEWLQQAFPWLPRVVEWLFVEYQEAFEFAYRAATSLGRLLQVDCDGLRGLFLTSLLCGGMASICITQKMGTTEALARLKTQTECSPKIHTFLLCGVCHFISTRLTELFITMGNGAFIHTVKFSAAFLGAQRGYNPACVSGPDGFLGVISLPFLWSVTLFSLYFLFDIVFKVKVNQLWRNSIDNLGAAVLTSLGLWHDQAWCGSNMKLLKIKETIAQVEKEVEARAEPDAEAMEGWRRAFAKNLMQAYADFLSTSLMVLPLGVVLGKFTQCSNAGSLLARTSLPLPKSGWEDHVQKLLALLRFCLLLLIPLLPESAAPSLIIVGVVLVGLESLLKAAPAVPVRCIRPAAASRVHQEPLPPP